MENQEEKAVLSERWSVRDNKSAEARGDDPDAPLALYHGSTQKIESFVSGLKNGMTRPREGNYLTDDAGAAAEFGSWIMVVSFEAERPADLRPWPLDAERPDDTYENIVRHIADETERQRYQSKSPYAANREGLMQTPEFRKAAREAGYDAIIMEDEFAGAGFDSYITLMGDQQGRVRGALDVSDMKKKKRGAKESEAWRNRIRTIARRDLAPLVAEGRESPSAFTGAAKKRDSQAKITHER